MMTNQQQQQQHQQQQYPTTNNDRPVSTIAKGGDDDTQGNSSAVATMNRSTDLLLEPSPKRQRAEEVDNSLVTQGIEQQQAADRSLTLPPTAAAPHGGTASPCAAPGLVATPLPQPPGMVFDPRKSSWFECGRRYGLWCRSMDGYHTDSLS